ncbi:hypothetical protein BCV71DRAFT_231859 [Rhizopus microsporus]|uniref:Uncharacterized protein n=1 Tax=Rhizopus microsporus TaxID=58291 RepID=A0A1X0SCM7_RHIZD|nr:hypothetical protein BCV71DRAFT_231859 [Rhizopus microsporus]
MGFEAQLTILSVKDKGMFTTEDVFKFSFPTIKKQIRQGTINNIIKALSLTQHIFSLVGSIRPPHKILQRIHSTESIQSRGMLRALRLRAPFLLETRSFWVSGSVSSIFVKSLTELSNLLHAHL